MQNEYIQLELIPMTDIEALQYGFKEVKSSCDKVRKGLFRRNTELSKKVQELTCHLELLQQQMMMLENHVRKSTQHGFAQAAQSQQEQSGQKVTWGPFTQIYATSADKRNVLQSPGTGDIQTLSESA